MKLLEVRNLKKVYQTRLSDTQIQAIQTISFSVEKGEYIAIMGESGSGKSTLLNIIATLDAPTSGAVFINGMDASHVPDQETAEFRRNHLGFVFQDFNLLDTFSVRDNILLPLVLAKSDIKRMEKRVIKLTKQLGIESLLDKYPYELSGGQQQRVAVARALITRPELLLADEPTGALDSKTANRLLSIFQQVNQTGQTILMVTHSAVAASRANRVLFLKDGQIYHQLYRGNRSDDELLHAISDTMTSLLTKEE